jgi:hypothetical protein
MKSLALWVLVVMLGCGGKQEDPPKEQPPKEADSGGVTSRLGGLADRAKELGDEAAGKAKSVGDDVAGKAKSVGSDVVDKAKAMAEKAGDLSSAALTSGKQLKADLDGKLNLAKMDYDLAIDALPESESDHKARLAGMKQIKVGAYTVGLAQDTKHPLGTVYKWQFRITWRVIDGRAIRLSLFTNEELPDLEVAANLLTIVTAAERVLH